MVSQWYVITGAPCSGKTTVLKLLGKLGYLTVPEAARVIADKEIRAGKSNEEVKADMLKFQRTVLNLKVKTESRLPKDKIVFFDRGIPDSIAYFELYGFDAGEVLKFCRERTYGKVFLLERLPFQKDYSRIENDEIAARIQELLAKAYSNLGYEITRIPIMSSKDRAKLIIESISHR
jgi:predicted ATPase